MNAQLTILGSNSALPAYDRHPSAQILEFKQKLFLIDCGEGTQMQLSRYSIRRSKIEKVFISHLHGDHIFGLPGFISSFNHFNRSTPLLIYGPKGLKNYIEHSIYVTGNRLEFELQVHEFDAEHKTEFIHHDEWEVYAIPLKHRIPTAGYIFTLKDLNRKIRTGSFEKYKVPHTSRSAIQKGKDYIDESGNRIPNEVFTHPQVPPLRYAYISDTDYLPELAEQLNGIHTLYHEATFLDDLRDKARATLHSTAREAALLAREAGVNRLILGHFSSRYKDLQPFLVEARSIFPPTELAVEGEVFDFLP